MIFYSENDGDYAVVFDDANYVYGVHLEEGYQIRTRLYQGRAPQTQGKPSSVANTFISQRVIVACLTPIPRKDVPKRWLRYLDPHGEESWI